MLIEILERSWTIIVEPAGALASPEQLGRASSNHLVMDNNGCRMAAVFAIQESGVSRLGGFR
jgi:hypothetical protein